MRTVKFFWQYFKDYTLSFIIVIVMMIASTILQVLFPIYVGQAVQHLVELGNALANGGEKKSAFSCFCIPYDQAVSNLSLSVNF